MIKFILEYWLQILFSIIIAVIMFMYRKIISYKNKIESTENGVKVLLKAKIIEHYNRVIDNGYLTLHEKQAMLEMYEEYKKLGGNGIIKDLMKELNEVEIKSYKGMNK